MRIYRTQRETERSQKFFRSLSIQLLVYALLIFSTPPVLSAAVFHVPAGDVPGLIAAINTANANGEENTIILDAGIYTLTTRDNFTVFPTLGSNGLPVVTSVLTLRGAGAEVTSIARDASAPSFRILVVAATGTLKLDGLTIRGGGGVPENGGGVASEGRVSVISTTITQNRTASSGGGLFNTGAMTITNSTIANNFGSTGGGGGIANRGTMTITDSTISGNGVFDQEGGGIINSGTLVIINSTIANNLSGDGTGGGLFNSRTGNVTIQASTIAHNTANSSFPDSGLIGGIRNSGGIVTLQNTILALNTVLSRDPPLPADCSETVISLGNNLIGEPSGCAITLQASDRTGDPGLGGFIDDGAPGGGRVPLKPGSQAIDAGNESACSSTDQLGTPRNGPCDIGAVEFYPVVNDLVALENLTTAFDPTPVSGAPAGTFHITAAFANTSNQAIVHPFVEVVELTEENLLLNADGGAGGVGARVTPPGSSATPFQPGASSTFEFLIGLQNQAPFTFFVSMLGDPQTSNLSVSKR
jgi:hypothetical protein